ncbi:MAG: hypothetical protein ACK4E8_09830 [Lacibacter sp.]|jgi:hypothetical protein
MQHQPPPSNRKIYKAYKMEKDGNIDFQYWQSRTPEERLAAAAIMIEVAFKVRNFFKGKVNRSFFSFRKHNC